MSKQGWQARSERYRQAQQLGIDLRHEHIPAPRVEPVYLDKVCDDDGRAIWPKEKTDAHIVYNERIEVDVQQ